MQTNGRFAGAPGGKFVSNFLPRGSGVRVDHETNPTFWLEIAFDAKDIDHLRGNAVYLVESGDSAGSRVIFASCRLASAKRFLRKNLQPQFDLMDSPVGIPILYEYCGDFILIRKVELSP